MERLENLCKVLGSNYQEKLEEIGLVPGQETDEKSHQRLEQLIGFLEETKNNRFSELKVLGTKLMDLWEFSDTPSTKILDFSEVLICMNLESSDELTDEKSLSTSFLNKVKEQVGTLEVAKLEKNYFSQKQKLLKLIAESHLVVSEFHYDPEKEVASSDFSRATEELKLLIENVKARALGRKEIVLRTVILKQAVEQSLDIKKIQGFYQSLEEIEGKAVRNWPTTMRNSSTKPHPRTMRPLRSMQRPNSQAPCRETGIPKQACIPISDMRNQQFATRTESA